MDQYLLFSLAAPIASFGTIAVGERRPTWDRPSKSQVLGLVAAALGIERADEAAQTALAGALHFAVRVDDAGHLQSDYHTTQVPPQRKNRRFATRAEELAVDPTELKTILSRREFRVGSHYTIALWRNTADGDATPLQRIAEQLLTPVFVPFAGRKANALMLPLSPRLVEVDGLAAAFSAYDAGDTPERRALRATYWLPKPSKDGRIYADADAVPRQLVDRLEQRRDMPESRAKWRFGVRQEALLKSNERGDQ